MPRRPEILKLPARWIFLLLSVPIFVLPLQAQIKFTDNISLRGNTNFFHQYYSFKSDPGTPAYSRRPKNYSRFNMFAELTAYDLKIPITISLSNNTISPIFPAPKNPDFWQFLRYPGNIIRISPTIRGVKLDLGSHTPVYSTLSVGDLQIFGAGGTYENDNYSFRLNFGTSQNPIENVNFKKYMITGRVAKKFRDKQYIALNVVSVNDRINSVDSIPPVYFDLPQKGLIISLDGIYNLTKDIALKCEIGNNAFTYNKNVDSIKNEFSPAALALPSNSGGVSGMAGLVEFDYHKKLYGLKFMAKSIGQDYVMIGYPFQASDIFDLTVSPYGYFLNKKLTLKGVIGRRANNVSGRSAGTRTSQLIVNIGGVYLPIKNLDVNFNVANYGVRTNTINDTFNIQIIARTISVIPVYHFDKFGLKHTVSLGLLLDNYNDLTAATDAVNDNKITNIYVKYNAQIKKYTGGIMLGSYRFRQPGRDYNLNSATLSAMANVLKNKMSARAAYTLAKTANNGVTLGNRKFYDISVRYSISKKLQAEVNVSNNHFSYGEGATVPTMNEFLNRFTLNYRF
ncbi:MAG: hypothetical protein GC181_07350 [Bacteroidetes bacterium]|nr:hypothetical protein [Bacteroidota bacterium]